MLIIDISDAISVVALVVAVLSWKIAFTNMRINEAHSRTLAVNHKEIGELFERSNR